MGEPDNWIEHGEGYVDLQFQRYRSPAPVRSGVFHFLSGSLRDWNMIVLTSGLWFQVNLFGRPVPELSRSTRRV